MNSPKLTIELVPSTIWYSNVRQICSKSQWDKIRKASYRAAGYRCEICGGQGPKHPVECHEVWNYDDQNKVQTLVCMISLCPNCHLVKHIGFSQVINKFDIALQHLANVNGWNLEQAIAYVDQQFQQWERRSHYDWKQDLSVLEDYL